MHERGEAGHGTQSRLRVHRAHLDGAEPRVRPDVPPQVRVVGQRAGRAPRCRRSSRSRPSSRTGAGSRRAGSRGRAARGRSRSPESRPCQNGEWAASACSSGRWPRRRLKTAIAVSASGIPTCTCSAQVGVALDAARASSRGCGRSARPARGRRRRARGRVQAGAGERGAGVAQRLAQAAPARPPPRPRRRTPRRRTRPSPRRRRA